MDIQNVIFKHVGKTLNKMRKCLEDPSFTDKDVDWLVTQTNCLRYLLDNASLAFPVDTELFNLLSIFQNDIMKVHEKMFNGNEGRKDRIQDTLIVFQLQKMGVEEGQGSFCTKNSWNF